MATQHAGTLVTWTRPGAWADHPAPGPAKVPFTR
jgi:hypothetical protein